VSGLRRSRADERTSTGAVPVLRLVSWRGPVRCFHRVDAQRVDNPRWQVRGVRGPGQAADHPRADGPLRRPAGPGGAGKRVKEGQAMEMTPHETMVHRSGFPRDLRDERHQAELSGPVVTYK